MFSLANKQTLISLVTQTLLENSGLPVSDPNSDDSFALVLYRKDPIDDYFYLTAYAGLREPEPMFGPLNYIDFRWGLGSQETKVNPYGFKQRENTSWVESIDEQSWQLHINGRQGTSKTHSETKAKMGALIKNIGNILGQEGRKPIPLYPELWYQERLARDNLRQSIQALPPGSSLEEVAHHLSKGIEEMFVGWLPRPSSFSVGIYLDSGTSWKLISPAPMRPWLPADIDKLEAIEDSAKVNAFDWVGQSTRSLLLRFNGGTLWKERLRRCGSEFEQIVDDPTVSGILLIAILHAQQQWNCMGIIMLLVRNSALYPAHLYLLSRLSVGISGYLMPLLPIQGFPWWPDAKLSRGRARIGWKEGRPNNDEGMPVAVVEAATQDLLPTESEVKISSLRSGQSGSHVFRLKVSDGRGIPEVPRVLKIGTPRLISDELRRYYRYVHNKKVGGSSRVDIARGFSKPHRGGTFREAPHDTYGAIVYTFVGAGDEAIPWAQWVKRVSVDEFAKGLDLLYDQLIGWYNRLKPDTDDTIIDLMIKPFVNGKLKDYLEGKGRNPGYSEVRDLLRNVSELRWKDLHVGKFTSVVHGDMHSENVFAILSLEREIKGVALIDWGHVRSERHPLTDISRLVTDIVYGSCPDDAIVERAFRVGAEWGRKLGCGEGAWEVALVHQIARMILYRANTSGRNTIKPYIDGVCRVNAWAKLIELAGVLRNLK